MTDEEKKARFGKALECVSDAFLDLHRKHMASGNFCAALEALLAARAIELREMDAALKYAANHR